MSEFVASNGSGVGYATNGVVYLATPDMIGKTYLSSGETDALREFFRDERDRELGRWRSKGHPDFIAYEHGDGRVRFVRESDGVSYSFDRATVDRFYLEYEAEVAFQVVAREYFEAHPEPKPWQDAKPGEVWVIDFDGHTDVVCRVLSASRFTNSGHGFIPLELSSYPAVGTFAPVVTAGRRIWPEQDVD